MQTYEVRFALETGYTLNVLITADNRDYAVTDAERILHGVGVKANRDYSPNDTDVRAVLVHDDHPATA